MSQVAIDTAVPISEWGLTIDKTFLCAGPCAVESEKQIRSIASALKDAGIGFLRGGIWKPRTRPGSFEGIGRQGLEWLQGIRKDFDLPVGVEVATPAHVEACLRSDVDVLWIGARTTPNPFAVAEIVSALRGTDARVLVKNPINPDLELWIGALERLSEAGLTRIGAVHRGFSTPTKGQYRFAPCWHIPIELKQRLPNVPVLCDPSHICGAVETIPAIAQLALDLLLDGLMLEVHCDPAAALSDTLQQVTPGQFKRLVADLTVKREKCDSISFSAELDRLRSEVDDIDGDLLTLLVRRGHVVTRIGALKRSSNISSYQPERWKKLLANRVVEGESDGLSPTFVQALFQIIHDEALRTQGILGAPDSFDSQEDGEEV